MAVGDFDRNGTLDVAAANGGASSFTVLLGDGLGGLVPLATTGSATNPADIVTGDLDRDGVLDLVVASGSAAQVLAHRGLPGGSFVTGVSSNVGVVPSRIALADFNRDGLLDLVVVSQASHSIRVFQGLGSTSFGTVLANVDLSASTPAPVAAAAADLDGDGDLDLAVALASTNQVAVFLGNGTGALAVGPTIAVGTSPRDVFVGDLNRDGRPDLVAANAGSADVSVLLGTGAGNFTLQSTVSVSGATPARVALADLDHDGTLDLAVLDETLSAPRLVAFEGNTTPALFDPTPYAAILAGPSAARGLALGDLTSDGRVDFVTALSATGRAVVVQNASGTSCARTSFGSAPRVFSAGHGPVSVAVADYDEDGRSDMVVASPSDFKIQFLKATGSGFALPFAYTPSLPARGVATADFDFDGHADVVAALGSAGGGQVQILRGDGTGAFTFGASRSAGVNTSAVAVGDFDGNGTPDVAAVSENDGGVWVFLGDGAGGLSPAPGNPMRLGMNGPKALVVAELTGDGKPDLAVAASGGSTVEIFTQRGRGHVHGGGHAERRHQPLGDRRR